MSNPRLPALRLTADGDCIVEEGVYLDPPSKTRPYLSSRSFEGHPNMTLESRSKATTASPTTIQAILPQELEDKIPTPQIKEQPSLSTPSLPERFNMTRTISMPLPSHLSQLQHPHRSRTPSDWQMTTPRSPHVGEMSMELADSIQLAIQTMLQISPSQVLDPAKEQFSACALSVPTSSMSALFTAMKNINYISANMSSFCDQSGASDQKAHNEFDVGEMLQCIGDALSGVAAQNSVDLVIYHGDVGLKHVYVSGDESGTAFALSHIIRQVLSTAERGDSIELGLLVSPVRAPQVELEDPPIDDMLSAAPLEAHGPVKITIRISHKYAPSDTHQGVDHPKDVVTTEFRPRPYFSTLLLRRILHQIGGTLISDLPPPEAFTSGRTCDLEIVLDRVPIPIPSRSAEETPTINLGEPTLEQLSSFGETLKGKRVTLYASARGSFAHHLTSYLTTWGMDVTHVSPDGQVDGLADQNQDDSKGTYTQTSSLADERPATIDNPSFIVVDDDVDILKERLQTLRFEHQSLLVGPGARKRPPLASRARSTSQMARLLGSVNNFGRPVMPIVILHFTSLANYKIVRDIMTSVTISYTATSTPLPEVMIIPKPAGPRRFLTALHTAVTKPIVDPLFMPIATSPASPGLRDSDGSFFAMGSNDMTANSNINGSVGVASQAQSPITKHGARPRGSRSNSDRSTRSNSDAANTTAAIPPSPLALPENVEYFSTAAAQKLGSSPSSGLVIQSPDGQTAGIYFHPRSKNNSRNVSSSSIEKSTSADKSNATHIPSNGKSRVDFLSMEPMGSFSSLHEAQPRRAEEVSTSYFAQPDLKRFGSSSQVAASPRTKTAPPADDTGQAERPPVLPPNLTPVTRKKSDDRQGSGNGGVASPETPSQASRRSVPKRGSDARNAAAANKKRGKTALSDNTVVPPISVLIVDDNPINQTILSTFMKRKRIKYDLASNGQEAVQKWKTGDFHLILMDIQMPVMDGIQATIEIRRIEKLNGGSGYPLPSPSERGQRSPSCSSSVTSLSEVRSVDSPYRSSVIIVALTASSLQSDRVAALAAGCNDFLTKPVSLLWLNNKIIEWGSIKALQMWADIRPDAVASMQSGQAEQATRIASRLHVPAAAKAAPTPVRRSSLMDDNAAALALASSAGPLPNIPGVIATMPSSPTGSYFKTPDLPASADSSRQASSASEATGSLSRQPVKRRSVDSEDDTPKAETGATGSRRGADSGTPNSRSITPIQSRISAPPLRAGTSSPPKLNFSISKSSEPRPANGDSPEKLSNTVITEEVSSPSPPGDGRWSPTQ